jgi:L-rhamnono-1,4-lactonase
MTANGSAMRLLDSHVHIWSKSHLDTIAWQSPDNPIYSQYSINEYVQAIGTDSVASDDHQGFIFVEADRKFSLDPVNWTEPVNELKYALSAHRGELAEGYSENGKLLRGLVAWAPIPLGAAGMTKYTTELCNLCDSESELRRLLKGFRYLIQNKPLGACVDEKFVDGVRWCGENEYLFELGVDFQNCGRPQLDQALQLVQQAPNTLYVVGVSLSS